jgi:hypothetical protein
VRSNVPLVAGVVGGALVVLLTASGVGPSDHTWTGPAFGWIMFLWPFGVTLVAARRWGFNMRQALLRCLTAFIGTFIVLVVLGALSYTFFG